MNGFNLQTVAVLQPKEQIAGAEIGALLDQIERCLSRYIVFPMAAQPVAIALWVAHAWALDAFDFTPYIHIQSPEKRCGKSLVLDVLEQLVPAPMGMVTPSEAVLFRAIDSQRPTVLFDEVDTVFSGGAKDDRSEGVRGILNAGFKRTGFVPRCVGDSHEIRNFSVFCAKVLAGIGKLPDTVADRSIPIVLARKTKAQKAERFRDRDARTVTEPIQAALRAWAEVAETIQLLRDSRPVSIEELGDRQTDICEPLLAIADLAGGEWPARARAALLELYGTSEGDTESLGSLLLRDIRRIFQEKELNRISTNELLECLLELEESPWAGFWSEDCQRGNRRGPAQKIARHLKPFGIASKTYRFAEGGEAKGYEESAFADAWERYL